MPSPEKKDSRISRRALLQGAATAGAAGLAVTAIGVGASPALAATDRRPAKEAAKESDSQVHPDGPIVLYVRDLKAGDIEVLHGTTTTQLRDKELAARIARAMK